MTGESTVKAKAAQLWLGFSGPEKSLARFGLLPHDKLTEAMREGYSVRELSVAIMQCAKKNGGMVA